MNADQLKILSHEAQQCTMDILYISLEPTDDFATDCPMGARILAGAFTLEHYDVCTMICTPQSFDICDFGSWELEVWEMVVRGF